MARRNSMSKEDLATFVGITSDRRLLQEVANRVDRLGAMLEAKILRDNATATTVLADVTAAQAANAIYFDKATAKAFDFVK